MNWLGVDGVQI